MNRLVALLTHPTFLLRIEGGAVLLLALAAYEHMGAHWTLFALLLLVPDLSALGYLAGNRAGAAMYNLMHAMMLPAALAIGGLLSGLALVVSFAAIWFAHIGMDRLLGYGLKEGNAPGRTHLGVKALKHNHGARATSSSTTAYVRQAN